MTLRHKFPLLAGALLPVTLTALLAGWFYIETETPYYGGSAEETFVEISKGMNADSAAQILEQSGIVRHRFPLIVYLRLTGDAERIKAGEYRFAEPASPRQIADRLVTGDSFYHAVTVPEGLTAMETVDLFLQKGLGKREEMVSALQRTEWISDMFPDATSLEGFLFPETYHLGRTTSPDQIIRAMVAQFRKEYGRLVARYPVPEGWNGDQIVILASMIEKEAQKAEERPLVSSVFHNRIRRKIPLACDATIIYAMKLLGTYKGNIRKTDLAMESPYNTYRNRGLPPGPIANPGAEALTAALRPADSRYLYYVSRNDGTHVFSETYQEHQKAVDKYQRSGRP